MIEYDDGCVKNNEYGIKVVYSWCQNDVECQCTILKFHKSSLFEQITDELLKVMEISLDLSEQYLMLYIFNM